MRRFFAKNPDGFSAAGERLMPYTTCGMPQHTRMDGCDNQGYSLVELMMVIAIISTLAAIAIPSYTEIISQAKVLAAIGDIRHIQFEIDSYFTSNGSYPMSLDLIDEGDRRDPWGQPYQYLKIAGESDKKKGKVKGCRKDKNLVPLNADYDLFSMGRDKDYVAPITAKKSWDDIIRANNGSYIGLAKKY
jgi:general secretion pathway protein G